MKYAALPHPPLLLSPTHCLLLPFPYLDEQQPKTSSLINLCFPLFPVFLLLLALMQMASPKVILALALLACSLLHPCLSSASYNRSIEMPTHPLSFNSGATSGDKSPCHHHPSGRTPRLEKTEPPDIDDDEDDADDFEVNSSNRRPASSLKLHLKHRSATDPERSRKESLNESKRMDASRIEALFRRITERKNQNTKSRLAAAANPSKASPLPKAAKATPPELAGRLIATLESGVTLGSGEYFMDVFIGTEPRHFSLILDTGSDLNWIQCLPCNDCFEQHGPIYDPTASSSYRNVTCSDPRCGLVSSPDPPRPCSGDHQPCPYYYWYGDRSNTTGDLALETFTVNLTASDGTTQESHRVEDVMFGCGHWNRGLFHGAAGLLGLGRGPLSFSSQLRALYGHTFSYCLVDRNSDLSVSSKLIFGEDPSLMGHPDLNYTSFVAGKENQADTFYYVRLKGIMVGGELLDIPPETWELSIDGAGGTIIDSGTTLSYFADPAYRLIRDAFAKRVKYPLVEDFPVLNPCYNVSGIDKAKLPEFAILFADGAMWRFPAENYFIRLEQEEIMCLAFLGTPRSSLSIIGNYQQQNFHILYDTHKSRLGFAPMRCAEV